MMMMVMMMLLLLLLPRCASAIRSTNIGRLRPMVRLLRYACCGRKKVGLLLLLLRIMLLLLLMVVRITHIRSRLRIPCRNGVRQRMVNILMLRLLMLMLMLLLRLRWRMLMQLRMGMVLLRMLGNRWQGYVPTRWS